MRSRFKQERSQFHRPQQTDGKADCLSYCLLLEHNERPSRSPLHYSVRGEIYKQSRMQIKWLPLRLNILPLIHKQVKHVLDLFLLTRAEIQEGDILSLEHLKNMRQEVEERIKKMDLFYSQHPLDPRMKYLFGTRSILAQVCEGCIQLQQTYEKYLASPQDESRVDRPQDSIVNQHSFEVGHTESNKIITPKSKQVEVKTSQKQSEVGKLRNGDSSSKKVSQISRQQEGKVIRQEVIIDERVRLSDIKKQPAKSGNRSPHRLTPDDPRKGTGRKVQPGPVKQRQGRSDDWLQNEKQRRQTVQRLSQESGQVKKSFKDLSELVFTIKMTKEEYNQFMRLKRKNHHA